MQTTVFTRRKWPSTMKVDHTRHLTTFHLGYVKKRNKLEDGRYQYEIFINTSRSLAPNGASKLIGKRSEYIYLPELPTDFISKNKITIGSKLAIARYDNDWSMYIYSEPQGLVFLFNKSGDKYIHRQLDSYGPEAPFNTDNLVTVRYRCLMDQVRVFLLEVPEEQQPFEVLRV